MEKDKDLYVIAAFMLTLILAIIASSIRMNKNHNSKKILDNRFEYNAEIKNLRVYIPSDWNLIDEKFRVSPSGNCKVLGGTIIYDQDRMERIFIQDELDHEEKIINGINMSYGYKEEGTKKTYSYFFEDDGTKYFMLFISNNDDECNPYLERIEKSITLVKE